MNPLQSFGRTGATVAPLIGLVSIKPTCQGTTIFLPVPLFGCIFNKLNQLSSRLACFLFIIVTEGMNE
jgi:hypothetical protein